MHPSTQTYLDLATEDDAIHAAAVRDLRAAIPSLRALTRQAGDKADALIAVRCDETDEKIRCRLYEGQDKQKTIQRLVSEWHEKTNAVLSVLREAAEFDAQLVAAVTPKPEGSDLSDASVAQ